MRIVIDTNLLVSAFIFGHADFIITGDGDLLELHPFHGVKIVTITDFLQNYLS